MNIEEIRKNAPNGANRYSMSTGTYYKFAFKGIVSKKWNGVMWVNSTTPADSIRLKPL